MRRRPLVTCLLASAAGAAAALPLAAWAGPGGGDYPDLRADPPERPLLQRDTSASQPRLLLRFDGFVTNIGDGPLDVSGNPAAGQMMQRIRSAGTLTDLQSVPVVYETADGHNHWHLMRIMRYTLRAGTSASSPAVAPGMKVGFCLVDSNAAPAPSPARESTTAVYSTSAGFNQGFCGVGKPDLTSLRMGVSVGWRDLYDRSLPFQWVDVSETAPGTYHLAAEADPEDIVAETDEANGMGVRAEPVTVPGHVATAVGPTAVPHGAAATVTLASRTVGSPGTRAFRVTRAPANGTLNAAVGATITGSTVTYTPRAGFSGADSFEFVAVATSGDSAGFPRNPPQATATLQVAAAPPPPTPPPPTPPPPAPAPSVAISGAPQQMVAGTAVRLRASVTGASGGVTWSTSAGRIDGTGLLTAPAAPPSGGTLTVRAVSTAAPQASATAQIRVVAPPVPVAAPAPELAGDRTSSPAAGPGASGAPVTGAVARITTRRSTSGRVLLVRVTPPAPGRMAVAAVRGGRVIDLCVRPVTAGRPAGCALRLPARLAGMPVRVAVVVRGGTTRWSARAVSAR